MSKIINPTCPVCLKKESNPSVGMCWECHGKKMKQLEHDRKIAIEPSEKIQVKVDSSPFKDRCDVVNCNNDAVIAYDKFRYCSYHLVQHSYYSRKFIRKLLGVDFGDGLTSRQISSRIQESIATVSSKLTILTKANLIKRERLQGSGKQFLYKGLNLTKEIMELLKEDEMPITHWKNRKNMENPYRAWVDYEVKYLKDNWFKKTDKEIAKVLGRTEESIKGKRKIMGMVKHKTGREEAYVGLRTKIKELEKRNKLLVSENNALRGKKAKGNDWIDDKITGLMDKNKMLYSKIEEYKFKCNDLNRENKILQNRNKKLMENNQPTGNVAKLEDTIKNNEIVIEAQLQKIKDLEYIEYRESLIKKNFLEDNRKFKEENDELKEKMERILKDNDSINEHNEEVMAKLRKQIEKGNKQDCDKKIAKLKKELFNLLG